jgi:hypothetical protein
MPNKKTLYIAGKITGDPNYKEKFKYWEITMKKRGYNVVNPAWLPEEGFTWEQYIAMSSAMLRECEAILFLEDWKDSRGAKIEHELAKKMGKELLFEMELKVGEIEKTRTLYNWNKVSSEYNWVAVDKDGEICVYSKKPKKSGVTWFSDAKWEIVSKVSGVLNIDWENSLEERPQPTQEELDRKFFEELNERAQKEDILVWVKDWNGNWRLRHLDKINTEFESRKFKCFDGGRTRIIAEADGGSATSWNEIVVHSEGINPNKSLKGVKVYE